MDTQPIVHINVSTTFFPSAILPVAGGKRPDVIIHTIDDVFFYCHTEYLRSKSTNAFGNLLATSPTVHENPLPDGHPGASVDPAPGISPHPSTPPPLLTTIHVREHSAVFNIILHIIYDISTERFGPDLSTISSALDRLPHYGFSSPGPAADIWTQLLRLAPSQPLPVYSLLAANAVDSACVISSELTLSGPLSSLSEADALVMGPLYLRRLFFLHLGRLDALKRVLSNAPDQHDPTTTCKPEDQWLVRTAWRAAVAQILLGPNCQATPVATLVTTLGNVAEKTGCEQCRHSLQERLAAVIRDWQAVRRTI